MAKLNKTQDVDDAVSYLKDIFWTYANNERYNYSRDQYHDAVRIHLIGYFEQCDLTQSILRNAPFRANSYKEPILKQVWGLSW